MPICSVSLVTTMTKSCWGIVHYRAQTASPNGSYWYEGDSGGERSSTSHIHSFHYKNWSPLIARQSRSPKWCVGFVFMMFATVHKILCGMGVVNIGWIYQTFYK